MTIEYYTIRPMYMTHAFRWVGKKIHVTNSRGYTHCGLKVETDKTRKTATVDKACKRCTKTYYVILNKMETK